MKFFVKEIDTQKETSILLVKTGSINEGKYQGLSHLLEHLYLLVLKHIQIVKN